MLIERAAHPVRPSQHLMHQILEARARGYPFNTSENRPNVCARSRRGKQLRHPIVTVAISMSDIQPEPTRVPEWMPRCAIPPDR